MVSPLIISRRYFLLLIFFLLISPMSYAVCDPKEAYNDNTEKELPTSENIYISEGSTLIIAEGTTISGANFIHTSVKKAKTKLLKRNTEKPKVVEKKIVKISKPKPSAPSVETLSSNDTGQTWGTNAPYSKQISITSNTSIKYFAAVMGSSYINAILSFIILLMAVYQRHITNTLLLGCNFQRPPPIFF